MAKKDEFRTPAIVAGVAVTAGIIYFAFRKKNRCKELPDIWDEGDLHLTQEAQEQIFDLSRRKLASQIIASGEYTLYETQEWVANQLVECDWEEKKTDKQKQVWTAIGKIVARVAEEAKQMGPYEFATKYGGGGD